MYFSITVQKFRVAQHAEGKKSGQSLHASRLSSVLIKEEPLSKGRTVKPKF